MISIGGKIPISIHPIFFLVAAIIGFLSSQSVWGTILWIGVITISVIVHELGHAITAMIFGQKARIELVGFGGLTHHDGKTLKPWQNFIVVLNGPIAGFLLCAAAFLLYQTVPLQGNLKYAVTITVFINLFWTVINLLPVQPLDGGKLMGIVLEKTLGPRGIRLSYLLSIILAMGFAFLFFLFGLVIAGAIFFLFAFESYRVWSSLKNITTSDRDVELQEMLQKAAKKMEAGEVIEAENLLATILNRTQKGLIYQSTLELLGKIYFDRGDYDRAFLNLYPIREALSPAMTVTFHQLAGMMEKWDVVRELSEIAYSTQPNYQTALLNATAEAVKGDKQATLGWLMRAQNDGAPNIQLYVDRPEFNPFRDDIKKMSS